MKKTNWSHPPKVLELKPNVVDIWRVHIDIPADARQRLEATLSAEETERIARFHFQADKDRFIAAHGCLRDVLARYVHCEPPELSFSNGEHGKPSLSSDERIDFNLTHSGDYALIATARGRKVGIDVERIRQGISSHVIARQYFSKAEVAELQALPIEEREVAFFTCWTRKEAYIKAQGLGLTLPLESFDVSLTAHEPAMLRATRPDPKEAARWTLLSLDVDPGYGAAVAVENPAGASALEPNQGLEFRLLDWTAK